MIIIVLYFIQASFKLESLNIQLELEDIKFATFFKFKLKKKKIRLKKMKVKQKKCPKLEKIGIKEDFNLLLTIVHVVLDIVKPHGINISFNLPNLKIFF